MDVGGGTGDAAVALRRRVRTEQGFLVRFEIVGENLSSASM
jgi:ubiquinone/menaquinone biosynthesis C-methylase UbiE